MTENDTQLSLTTPLEAGTLILRSLAGDERLSGLFRFRLRMVSDESAIDLDQLVGQPATATIETGGVSRHFNGVVGRVTQAGLTRKGQAVYRADLYPSLWLLGMSSDCRVFQQMSVPEIVEQVLAEHGLTDYVMRLSGSYDSRDCCVQYRESALRFVSRLLEEEGVFYFFEHREDGHTLVLGDSAAAFGGSGDQALAYGDSSAGGVTDCSLERAVTPGRFAVDDFNFETPSTDLLATAESSGEAGGSTRRLYDYPGGFRQQSDGERLAEIRLDERLAERVKLRGKSGSPALAAGHRFSIAGHYRQELDGVYVPRRVTHASGRDGYTSGFDAFPESVAYRPPRGTPGPVIAGTQTAIVVGKSGEEIWADGHGRVKVQFHWDRIGTHDENSSCWVRVSHAWAGKGWGQLFLPRVGQEVVVGFEEGDPDRPVIVGRLYNAEQTPPVELPDDKTRSTIRSRSSQGGSGDGNELSFEDAAGAEEVYLRAQRALRLEVAGDERVEVGGDRAVSVGHDQTLTVGNDRTTTVEGGERHDVGDELVIEASKGVSIRVGDSLLTLEPDAIKLSAPRIELAATESLKLESNARLVVRSAARLKVASAASLDIDAGGNLTITGALVKIN